MELNWKSITERQSKNPVIVGNLKKKTLLNNTWVKEEVSREIYSYFELNEKENTILYLFKN